MILKKNVTKNFRINFNREITLLKECECEYSLKIYDAFETNDNYYIITKNICRKIK